MFEDQRFSVEDPILIFEFLTRIVKEADTLDISKIQLVVLLFHLLAVSAGDYYRAAGKIISFL